MEIETTFSHCITCTCSHTYIDGGLRCKGELIDEVCLDYTFGFSAGTPPELDIKDDKKVFNQKLKVKTVTEKKTKKETAKDLQGKMLL